MRLMSSRGVRPCSTWPFAACLSSLVLLAAALFFSGLAAAQGPPARPTRTADHDAVEARIAAEVVAESQEAAAAFERGTRLRDEGNLDGAAAAFEEAARLAPKSSHPLRRLCGVRSSQGRHDDAVARCREAVALADLPLNRAALADALLSTEKKADLDLAYTNAQIAFDRDTTDEYTAATFCRVAIARNDLHSLERGLARLRAIAPAGLPAHFFGAVAAAARGDWSEAEAEIEAARAAGLPAEDADRILARMREAEPAYFRYSTHLKGIGLGWLATLLVLIAGGFFLSGAALRSAARLPAERTGRAHGADALIRRAYKALLWIACAFYYLSIPLVLGIVLAGAGGIIYFFLWAGRIPIKLVLIVGLVALTTLWAVVKSLLVRVKDEDPGQPLDLAAHPRLREVLNEVASRVGTRPVDRVFLTPGTDIAVLERGGTFSRLRGRPMERCLILGLGVIHDMRMLDFKAVLAHEYGHFQNADTAGGGFALAVRRSLLLSAISMAQAGVAHWYNPAWWFVRGFFALFLRISQGASRLQEVLADRWAAFTYGAAAFEGGLRHAIAASVAFDARSSAVLNEVVSAKTGLRNLYTYQPEAPPDPAEMERAVEEALNREASPYDSHPSPAERFALVHRLTGTPTPEDDGTLALSLLSDTEAVQREMTREVCGRVAEQTGIWIPDEDRPKKRRREEADPEEASSAEETPQSGSGS